MNVLTAPPVSIKCAHCKERHGSVAEVRACATKLAPIAAKPVSEPGMYRVGTDVYLVKLSGNDRLYASRLVPTMHGTTVHKLTFEYDKGSIFKITAADRMTVKQVAELGKLTEHRWVCGKRLTVKKSIDAGIGPVCAKKV
jgi:hypothetical protein